MGCRASDHGLDYVPYVETNAEKATAAFKKAMAGEPLTQEEGDAYTTYLLISLGRLYKKYNVAMQIHYSCLRNVNQKMYKKLGPDTGFDMIAVTDGSAAISSLLSKLTETGECPKVILYSLNPSDFDMLGTLMGAFQGEEVPGKIQLGSAWWFCDTDDGMYQQMNVWEELLPGEEKTVFLPLGERSFAVWSCAKNRWVVEEGEYELCVGASCRDLRLVHTVHVAGEAPFDEYAAPEFDVYRRADVQLSLIHISEPTRRS